MLDQMVAFCGDPISTRSDVLKVFGFTSEQTVANLTERILRGATAEAIEGRARAMRKRKDMMKLMSSLISYLCVTCLFKVETKSGGR